jgi:RNA polymerase sigma-70 factor (ECF subfamily)
VLIRVSANKSAEGRDLSTELQETVADDLDIEAELERGEMAALLERAMGALSPDARALLVGHYVEHMPQVELARRLDMTEGAVKIRLHREKRHLRRVLLTDYEEGIRAYGFIEPAGAGWDETRLWCTVCGTRKLMGRLTRDTPGGDFELRCKHCYEAAGLIYHHSGTSLLGDVTRYKPALARITTWASGYFSGALRYGVAPCIVCGQPARLAVHAPVVGPPDAFGMRTLHVRCARCGSENTQSFAGLVLASREAQAFRRAHPRIRLLPERAVERDGRAAIVTSFESVVDAARLDVISACDTYETLAVFGASTG